MKKFYKFLTVMLVLLTLVGCGSKKLNSKRSKGYKFDFVDFINITVYGDDGNGYIEITPKDITVNDFDDEQDYINVKHDLDELNLEYRYGQNKSTGIKLSKVQRLRNGDVVTISVSSRVKLKSDMNTGAYEYLVGGLTQAQAIDLFSPDLVTFFMNDDKQVLYHIKENKALPDSLLENLVYEIKYTGAPEVDKTVLSVTATMNETYLLDSGYIALENYLAKHNLRAELETETVLKNYVSPVEFSSSNQTAIEKALYKKLLEVEPDLYKVCNIQQLERQKISEPYTYYVVYYNNTNENREYYRRRFSMVFVDGDCFVYMLDSREYTDEEYARKTYDGAEIVLNFMMGDEIQEEPVDENVEIDEYVELEDTGTETVSENQ